MAYVPLWNIHFFDITIHTDAWGGLPMRLIWMVCALACASFPVTGLWIYFSSLRSTRR